MKLLKILDGQFLDWNKMRVTIEVEGDNNFGVLNRTSKKLKEGKEVEVQFNVKKNKRSLDANNYAWLLCQKLAEILNVTKEEVYRQHIKEYGTFLTVKIANEKATELQRTWGEHGVGWLSELIGKGDYQSTYMLYPGSSTYDSKQMSRLIDGLVSDCHDQGIETMTPDELESLKALWKE